MLKSNKIQLCYVLGSLIILVTCLFLPSPVGASLFPSLEPKMLLFMLKLPQGPK